MRWAFHIMFAAQLNNVFGQTNERNVSYRKPGDGKMNTMYTNSLLTGYFFN